MVRAGAKQKRDAVKSLRPRPKWICAKRKAAMRSALPAASEPLSDPGSACCGATGNAEWYSLTPLPPYAIVLWRPRAGSGDPSGREWRLPRCSDAVFRRGDGDSGSECALVAEERAALSCCFPVVHDGTLYLTFDALRNHWNSMDHLLMCRPVRGLASTEEVFVLFPVAVGSTPVALRTTALAQPVGVSGSSTPPLPLVQAPRRENAADAWGPAKRTNERLLYMFFTSWCGEVADGSGNAAQVVLHDVWCRALAKDCAARVARLTADDCMLTPTVEILLARVTHPLSCRLEATSDSSTKPPLFCSYETRDVARIAPADRVALLAHLTASLTEALIIIAEKFDYEVEPPCPSEMLPQHALTLVSEATDGPQRWRSWGPSRLRVAAPDTDHEDARAESRCELEAMLSLWLVLIDTGGSASANRRTASAVP